MTSIGNLPSEILHQIFAYDTSEEPSRPILSRFCSLSLVNRRFHHITSPLLYRHIHCGFPGLCIGFLLRTFISRPDLGDFVHTASIGWGDSGSREIHELPSFGSGPLKRQIIGVAERAGIPYHPLIHVITVFGKEDEDVQVAILLYMLPKLEMLHLRPPEQFQLGFGFYRALTEPVQQLPAALKSINSIWWTLSLSRPLVKDLFCSLVLPSLRHSKGEFLVGEVPHLEELDLDHLQQRSNVRSMELKSCNLQVGALSSLLAIPKGLCELKYSHKYLPPLSPGAFSEALRQTRETLRHLDLDAELSFIEEGSFGCKLDELSSLETLRVPLAVLRGIYPLDGFQPLASLLPACIRRLCLRIDYGYIDGEELWEILEEFMEECGGKFTQLGTVELISRNGFHFFKLPEHLTGMFETQRIALRMYLSRRGDIEEIL